MAVWGQLCTQGGRIRGPESSLSGLTLSSSDSQKGKGVGA